jgi:membrane protein
VAKLVATHDAGISKAVTIGKTVVKAETHATRAAANTLVRAGRTAVAADRYVRRHPWSSVLVAAGTALFVAAVAGRRNGTDDAKAPPAASDTR